MGSSQTLLTELRLLEVQQDELQRERDLLDAAPKQELILPSLNEILKIARETIEPLGSESQEFARCMRQILYPIHVFPYRLCDGGHPVLRAEVHLTAIPFVPVHEPKLPGLTQRLSSVFTVDLFHPPQREAFREDVMRLTHANDGAMTERQIAAQLGITQPAVQNAKKLAREMQRCGLVDPYVAISEPPGDYGKLRRHHHRRHDQLRAVQHQQIFLRRRRSVTRG